MTEAAPTPQDSAEDAAPVFKPGRDEVRAKAAAALGTETDAAPDAEEPAEPAEDPDAAPAFVPRFRRRSAAPPPETAPAPDDAAVPEDIAESEPQQQAAEPSAPPEPEAPPPPRPRVVDAPDPPDDDSIDADPGLLSALAAMRALPPGHLDAIAPIAAELEAWHKSRAGHVAAG